MKNLVIYKYKENIFLFILIILFKFLKISNIRKVEYNLILSDK